MAIGLGIHLSLAVLERKHMGYLLAMLVPRSIVSGAFFKVVTISHTAQQSFFCIRACPKAEYSNLISDILYGEVNRFMKATGLYCVDE